VAARLDLDGRPRGVILMGLARRQEPGDGEQEALEGMARQAAEALERARLHEAELQVAETLQRSLLPASLPEVPGLRLAARYRAAAEHVEVGGDWYEAVTLPDGGLCLAVGDVVGRGVIAATVMGQLRSAMRALALEGAEPDLLLHRLNRFALGIGAGGIATAACVMLDAGGELRYACAGHPPPLVVGPANARRFLEEGRSPPLATSADSTFVAARTRLEHGETLLIYTDGLIERRRESLDEGLGRLARSAGAASGLSPDELADLVIAELLDGAGNEDDVALLAARRTAQAGRFRRSVRAVPQELAVLRRGVRDFLAAEGVDAAAAHDVLLACSEAAANAAEHAFAGAAAAGTVTVEIGRLPGGMDIIVADDGRWRSPSETPLRGMGLPIMRRVMEEVSVDASEAGTRVTMRWRGGR
jgi:serine phosphatase RsbU (regulator of sigma subunit)/anti-sigma regulatory factor (Ser/Thr protein kinase)